MQLCLETQLCVAPPGWRSLADVPPLSRRVGWRADTIPRKRPSPPVQRANRALVRSRPVASERDEAWYKPAAVEATEAVPVRSEFLLETVPPEPVSLFRPPGDGEVLPPNPSSGPAASAQREAARFRQKTVWSGEAAKAFFLSRSRGGPPCRVLTN